MKVIKFAPGLIPVLKHQEHDQSSHGSWADSGSPKLTILGKNDGTNEFFNEKTRVVRYQPEGKEPKDYVLFADEDFVVAFVKPTDGTTINGYSAWKKNKGEIGHLDVTGAGSNPWRSSAKDDNKATIVEVVVGKAHQRRGLASAMLRFHRDMFPELDVQHSDAQLPDGKAWADVAKHQEHDQSTHGSWADGSQGGNNLSHKDVYQLQSGMQDTLMRKIYDAEEKYQPNVQRELPKPFAPSRTEYQTNESYDKAYKAYSKAFDEWSRASTKNIKSTTGEKHLDGSKTGVQSYVNDVTSSDWFVERFGSGGVIGTPKVSLGAISVAGKYEIGTKNGVGYSRLSMDKGYSQAEPVILHELAHYATAISANKPYAGHGLEFARNYVYMASKVMGPEYAAGLESSYREGGVPLG